MRSTVRLLAFAALSAGALAAFAPATGCDGGGGPTGTGGSLCGRINFDSNFGIGVVSASGCTATTGGFTNEVRDQFGRPTSFNFDITCTAGASERLVGSVFNVTYNNLGQFVSAQATINGESCSYSF